MRDLTHGSVFRHVLRMAVLLMASLLAQSLYFLADMYWVGRLGKNAIAAVGLASNVMLVVFATTQALGVATTALVARAVGERDHARANWFFNQTLSLSIISGLGFFLLVFALTPQYVNWLAADGNIRLEAVRYLRWFVPAVALQYPLIATGAALRASGVVRPVVTILVTSVLLNIGLAPVLIFGWGTGHPLGVSGAAIATLIAMVCGALLLTSYMVVGQRYLRVDFTGWAPSLSTWRAVLTIGLPAAAELCVLAVYLAIVYTLLRPMGAAAQGGFAVGARVGQSLVLPAVAVAMAVSAIVGQNFGANRVTRIRETFRAASILSVVLMAVMLVVVRTFAGTIVGVFTEDVDVRTVATGYLQILALTFIATGFIFSSVGVFQGLGRTIAPFVSSVVRLLVFSIVAVIAVQAPGSSLSTLWIISALSIGVQMALNLIFLARQLRRLESSATL